MMPRASQLSNANRCRAGIVLCMLGGLAVLACASFVEAQIRIVYNASPSVTRGWYWIVPARELAVDDVVLARLPAHVAAFADERGYLPLRVPVLKRIGAVAPHHVCMGLGAVRIEGRPVARLRAVDGGDRPLPAWTHCRRLVDEELFLLSATHPASFDSRYFGPITVKDVIGRAQPVWTW